MKHRILCIFLIICLLLSAGCTREAEEELPQNATLVQGAVEEIDKEEQTEQDSVQTPIVEQEQTEKEPEKPQEKEPESSVENKESEKNTPDSSNQATQDKTDKPSEDQKEEQPSDQKTKPQKKEPADIPASLSQRSFAVDGYTLHYWQYTPKNATDNMPLIIYLHDLDARGNDLGHMIENDKFTKMLKNGTISLDAYVVIPHLSGGPATWAELGPTIRSLKESFCGIYGIDTKRVSVMGIGIGSNYVCSMAADHQTEYSCFVAIDNTTVSVQPYQMNALLTANLWIFHSQNNIMYGTYLHNTLAKQYGTQGTVKATLIYKDMGQTLEYVVTAKEIKLFDWMLAQRIKSN